MTVAALRAEARRLFDAAVTAADPFGAVTRALAAEPLSAPGPGGRQLVIALGKAAPQMLRAALAQIGGPARALCITHAEADVAGAEVIIGGHPVPDAGSLAGGEAIAARLVAARESDRVTVLISGGGSSLAVLPHPGMTLADKQAINHALLASGLDIVAMNLIRQQLSGIKGGGMARLAAPAPVRALVLSDVIGDDLRAIASGPCSEPLGTPDQAARILRQSDLWQAIPEAAKAVLSRPGDPGLPASANAALIGGNAGSVAAMAAVSNARMIEMPLVGDVAEAAQRVVALAEMDGAGLLMGGETTVRLTGQGTGGRNQELALRVAALAAGRLSGDWVFLSGGTDGRDGPTDAAGGLVDSGSLARMAAAGIDVDARLADNDSYPALQASGDLLITGPTGTNVADVQVFLRH